MQSYAVNIETCCLSTEWQVMAGNVRYALLLGRGKRRRQCQHSAARHSRVKRVPGPYRELGHLDALYILLQALYSSHSDLQGPQLQSPLPRHLSTQRRSAMTHKSHSRKRFEVGEVKMRNARLHSAAAPLRSLSARPPLSIPAAHAAASDSKTSGSRAAVRPGGPTR